MSEELELTPVYFENDGPYQDAQSAEELERYVMGSTFPKTPAEWWACREIESLRARIAELEAALKPFEEKSSKSLADAEELAANESYVLPDAQTAEDIYAWALALTWGDLRAARIALKGEKG